MDRAEAQVNPAELTIMARWLTVTGDPAYSRAVAKLGPSDDDAR